MLEIAKIKQMHQAKSAERDQLQSQLQEINGKIQEWQARAQQLSQQLLVTAGFVTGLEHALASESALESETPRV